MENFINVDKNMIVNTTIGDVDVKWYDVRKAPCLSSVAHYLRKIDKKVEKEAKYFLFYFFCISIHNNRYLKGIICFCE